jgi:DNA-binding PadR family transcriptional regulator
MQTCTDLKKSTAYYLLDKLAKNGYVAESTEQRGNRPVRRVYTITSSGEAYFQTLLRNNLGTHSPVQFVDMVGLAFLDAVPDTEAVPLLQQRRASLAKALAGAKMAPPHPGSFQYIIDHQIAHLQAEIEWLDGVIAALTLTAGESHSS